MRWTAPIAAVVLTALAGGALFAALGQDPLKAAHAFAVAPLSDINGLAEWLLKASPLCLIALGLAVGYRAGIWNIGAEGQMYVGGVAATGVAIHVHDAWGAAVLPAMVVAGGLAGMAWAAIPAWLRVRWRVSEILSSLMLTYVAGYLVKWLVYGPWQDPQANRFPLTESFVDEALWPMLAGSFDVLEGTRLNASLAMTLIAIPIAGLFVHRSRAGFRLQVAGEAPAAARFAGFSASRAVMVGMLAGGLAAGLAGVGEVAGPLGQLNDRWTPGYGYTAIIVAALGRLDPLGIVFASLLMALLHLGGEAVQIALQMPQAISLVLQGLLLGFLLGCDVLVDFRLVRK